MHLLQKGLLVLLHYLKVCPNDCRNLLEHVPNQRQCIFQGVSQEPSLRLYKVQTMVDFLLQERILLYRHTFGTKIK